MGGQAKAVGRRCKDWRFTNRWFRGYGLDVGSGGDQLDSARWPCVTKVDCYDLALGDADAQRLPEIGGEVYDFVHSSHCLEHLDCPRTALRHWLRVLRPGGFLVCLVPDELLYEGGEWPPRHNTDHRASFTLRTPPVLAGSINVLALLQEQPGEVEHLSLLTEHWKRAYPGIDQTSGPAECAIEFVFRKTGGQ